MQRDEEEITRMIIKLEEQLPRLKKQACPFDTLSVYGVIDALKWVIFEESNVPYLLDGDKNQKDWESKALPTPWD